MPVPSGTELVDSPHEGEEQEGNNAEWQEERTALEAIYDADVSFPSASCTILRLATPSDSAHHPLAKQVVSTFPNFHPIKFMQIMVVTSDPYSKVCLSKLTLKPCNHTPAFKGNTDIIPL